MTSTSNKIALLGKSFFLWGGGIDFLRYCANALVLKSYNYPMKIFLLIPNDDLLVRIKNTLGPFKRVGMDIVNFRKPSFYHTSSIDRTMIVDTFNKISSEIEIIFYHDSDQGLRHCLKNIGADVVLPLPFSLGTSFEIPWLGYIPDLQHKYFPDFFSKRECNRRDQAFEKILQHARAIIVNSKAVRNDLNRFFDHHNCHIISLPFAPFPDKHWFELKDIDVRTKYKLPNKYFVISNQFWVHKDHKTAFEGLAYLGAAHNINDIHIVCTGKTQDYRFPHYFSELQKVIRDLGISNRVHFLGYIPKDEQIKILCNSLGVLQPTLFEGGPGGGAVYDAVAMGIPAIVSDIPVNLEIESDNIYFFKTGSASDLAIKILLVMNHNRTQLTPHELIKKGYERIGQFADRLLQALSLVER